MLAVMPGPLPRGTGPGEIGTLKITRASNVEPESVGFLWADVGPVDEPLRGPFRTRSEAPGAARGRPRSRQHLR